MLAPSKVVLTVLVATMSPRRPGWITWRTLARSEDCALGANDRDVLIKGGMDVTCWSLDTGHHRSAASTIVCHESMAR